MRIDYLIAAVIGLWLVSRKRYSDVLGLKLNNPLNLRELHKDHNAWVGEHEVDLHPAFEEFISPEYGIRAGARVLQGYYERLDLDTVDKIIDRFAPESDGNPTRTYAANVAAELGIATNEPFNVNARMLALVRAMMKQEIGFVPYSDEFIHYSIGLTA